MDEELGISMWLIENIPDDATLYRLAPKGQMDRKAKHKPSAGCFTLRNAEDGLSVNWEKYSTWQQCLDIVGQTHRYNSTDFKDPNKFDVYGINAGFCRILSLEVVHDPIFTEDPPLVGNPNNRAHSLICYPDGNDEEYRLKIRDHAATNKMNP